MHLLNITADSTYIYHRATGLWRAESINVSNDTDTTKHSNSRCNSGTVFCGWALVIRLPFGCFPLLCLVQIQSHKSRSRIEGNFRKLKIYIYIYIYIYMNTKISNRYIPDREQNALWWTEKENGRNRESAVAEDPHDGRGQLKCDGARAETRFRLSAKRTSPFKSAGGRQFSRLLAAEVCASAVVMVDTPFSEVVWRVLATHCISQFPLHFPPVRHCVPSHFNLESTLYRVIRNECRGFNNLSYTIHLR